MEPNYCCVGRHERSDNNSDVWVQNVTHNVSRGCRRSVKRQEIAGQSSYRNSLSEAAMINVSSPWLGVVGCLLCC